MGDGQGIDPRRRRRWRAAPGADRRDLLSARAALSRADRGATWGSLGSRWSRLDSCRLLGRGRQRRHAGARRLRHRGPGAARHGGRPPTEVQLPPLRWWIVARAGTSVVRGRLDRLDRKNPGRRELTDARLGSVLRSFGNRDELGLAAPEGNKSKLTAIANGECRVYAGIPRPAADQLALREMMSVRSLAIALVRAPVSDGSSAASAGCIGTVRGCWANARWIASIMRCVVPHVPPITMSWGSHSAVAAVSTPHIAAASVRAS